MKNPADLSALVRVDMNPVLMRAASSLIWSYKGTACLEIRGRRNADGYVPLWWRGRWWYAHRASLTFALGRELIEGEIVRHLCNNRVCGNPLHLMVGDVLENVRDQIEAGTFARKHTPQKLQNADAAMIRFYLSDRCQPRRSVRWCADRYGVSRQAIRAIRDGHAFVGVYPADVQKPEYDQFAEEGE